MGYAALNPDFGDDGTLRPGFEYAMGIEIRHNRFVEHHACGAQDASGKAARLPMLKAIGYKRESIYNYHECWLWSTLNQPVPAERTRDGVWAATGSYIWLALSDGMDSHSAEHPVLDMRTKKIGAVRGSSECHVVWARDIDGSNQPRVISRRLMCLCEGCRNSDDCWHPEIHGGWKVHKTPLKNSLSIEASVAKKAQDKSKRQEARARKAAALRMPAALAPNMDQADAAVPDAAGDIPGSPNTDDVEYSEGHKDDADVEQMRAEAETVTSEDESGSSDYGDGETENRE